ncbi:MAG: hypothetical protein WD711_07535, partial [Dongiaceae bacterium]
VRDIAGNELRVQPDTKIEVLAPQLTDGMSGAIVVDEHGQPIGHVARESVVNVMMGVPAETA